MNLVLVGGLIVLVCVLYYFYTQSKNANISNISNSQTNVPTISINKVVPTTIPTSSNTPVPYSTQAVVAFLTTPLPTTLAPIITTPAPVITTPAPPTLDLTGYWPHYLRKDIYGKIHEMGPFTIKSTGKKDGFDTYLIESETLLNMGLREEKILQVDTTKYPPTVTMPERTDLMKDAQVLISGDDNKEIKISSKDITLSRPLR